MNKGSQVSVKTVDGNLHNGVIEEVTHRYIYFENNNIPIYLADIKTLERIS